MQKTNKKLNHLQMIADGFTVLYFSQCVLSIQTFYSHANKAH